MNIRPLIIDNSAKALAAKIVAYARQHPYHPGDPIPGDNPNFVGYFNTYRVVFTFTQVEGVTYRHLSVSVPSKKFANLAAVFMIAGLFGFTGWDEKTIDRAPEGWFGDVNKDEHCVTLAQVMEKPL